MAIESPALGRAGFSYGDLAIEVRASQPTLSWLAEFLSPTFLVSERRSYACTIAVREDLTAFEQALARLPAEPTRLLDVFFNDSHVVRLPAWTSPTAGTVVFQDGYRVLFDVDVRSRVVNFLSPEDNPRARTALMRIVRELAMNHSLRQGGAFLHAACLSVGGRGLVLAGRKTAGKTTLLMYLLHETGGAYIANDRVLIPSLAATVVRGMPTIVSLRAESLGFFPDLLTRLESSSYHHQRTMSEASAERGRTPAWHDGRFGVSPAQFCALLGVRPEAECVPRALVFPSRTNAGGGARLRELAPNEIAALLPGALLGADLTKKISDLFVLADDPPPPGEEGLRAIAGALAARVRCFECRLGTQAYEDRTLADACLQLLAE